MGCAPWVSDRALRRSRMALFDRLSHSVPCLDGIRRHPPSVEKKARQGGRVLRVRPGRWDQELRPEANEASGGGLTRNRQVLGAASRIAVGARCGRTRLAI